jgi:hypothetical protein
MLGVSMHVRPVGATVLVRVIVPLKVFSDLTVIVEFGREPGWTDTMAGDAVRENSGRRLTFTSTITEWETEPLVPVTFTWKVAITEPDTVRVAPPEPPVTVVELRVTVKLELFDTAPSRTLPANPLTGPIAICEVPVLPPPNLIVDGLAVMLKS